MECDDLAEGPVPQGWRPTLEALVDSLVRRDRVIGDGVVGVEPVSAGLRATCLDAIDAYGKVTLVSLPQEAWDTSVAASWGDRCRCLVDLWTEEEGRSDLVLEVDVVDEDQGPRFSVHLVYVP